MGKKLDALLGRTASKTAKLRALLSLTLSRLAILKTRRNARCSHASDDIALHLRNGDRERALLGAEYVVKDRNMVDVFLMAESYCNLLMERSTLMELNTRECPLELREAVSSLIFMASRSSELLELQDVRSIFASWYGREFADAAVQLRSGCAVNTKIVQKMATKQADFETRLKVVVDIARSNSISFDLDDGPSFPESSSSMKPINAEEGNEKQSARKTPSPTHHFPVSADVKHGGRFSDAASAAQAAFESAAYAADAALAAVELSRKNSHGKRLFSPPSNEKKELDYEPQMADAGSSGSTAADHDGLPVDTVGSSELEGEGSEFDVNRVEIEQDEKRSSIVKPFSVRTRRGG